MSLAKSRRARSCRGFSLIEILVVVGILALLSAIVFPAYQGAIGRAKDAQCLANLRQWGIALGSYLSESDCKLPYEGAEENPSWGNVSREENLRAWYNVLPPYVGSPGLSELKPAERAAIYTSKQTLILQCPRATWAGNERNAGGPRFSYAYNSKLPTVPIRIHQLANSDGANANHRTVSPSTVPLMLDARASAKEPKAVPGMNSDVGTALAYTRRFNNRHNGKGHILFFDGSVRAYRPQEIMDNSGQNIKTSPVIWNPTNPDEA